MDIFAQVEQLILPTAARYITKPEYWISGYDESLSFCKECGEKKAAELAAANPNKEYWVDGGYGSESDAEAFCETCQCALDVMFTDHACKTLLDYFESDGFNPASPGDCSCLLEIITATRGQTDALGQRVLALAKKILADAGIEKGQK